MIKAWMNSSAIKMDWMDGVLVLRGAISLPAKNLPQAKQQQPTKPHNIEASRKTPTRGGKSGAVETNTQGRAR
jgi:hypothetical protein